MLVFLIVMIFLCLKSGSKFLIFLFKFVGCILIFVYRLLNVEVSLIVCKLWYVFILIIKIFFILFNLVFIKILFNLLLNFFVLICVWVFII